MAVEKKTVVTQGLKLLSHPRFLKLMQDERIMKALVGAMSLPGKAQTFVKDQMEHVVKALDIATESEIRDLRRTVRRLEDELARLKTNDSGDEGRAQPKKKRESS